MLAALVAGPAAGAVPAAATAIVSTPAPAPARPDAVDKRSPGPVAMAEAWLQALLQLAGDVHDAFEEAAVGDVGQVDVDRLVRGANPVVGMAKVVTHRHALDVPLPPRDEGLD